MPRSRARTNDPALLPPLHLKQDHRAGQAFAVAPVFDELEAFALDGGDQAFEVIAVGLGEAELGLLAVVVMRGDDGADCVAVRYDRGTLNGARNRHVAHASAVAKEWTGEEFDRSWIEVLAKQTAAQGRIGFADGVLGHRKRQIVQRDFQ